MDEVQAFIVRNKHQLGYIMQEASRQWAAVDPVGALTVGPCVKQVEVYGEYFKLADDNVRMREALGFYANEVNHKGSHNQVFLDMGYLARETLKKSN